MGTLVWKVSQILFRITKAYFPDVLVGILSQTGSKVMQMFIADIYFWYVMAVPYTDLRRHITLFPPASTVKGMESVPVCVSVSVCLSALSWLNGLKYGLKDC